MMHHAVAKNVADTASSPQRIKLVSHEILVYEILVYDILTCSQQPERKECRLPPCGAGRCHVTWTDSYPRYLLPCGRGTVWILPVKLVDTICQTVTLIICCAVNGM